VEDVLLYQVAQNFQVFGSTHSNFSLQVKHNNWLYLFLPLPIKTQQQANVS